MSLVGLPPHQQMEVAPTAPTSFDRGALQWAEETIRGTYAAAGAAAVSEAAPEAPTAPSAPPVVPEGEGIPTWVLLVGIAIAIVAIGESE